jgi:putative redox protein
MGNIHFKSLSMKREVNLEWAGGLEFHADLDGHKITVDVDIENGGTNKGPRPKLFMLLSLAGCTAMDVVMILKKMRVDIKGLSIHVEADMDDVPPKAFQSMRVVYTFKGNDLPLNKLEQAVGLSKDQYCGVSATLKNALPITYVIRTEEA